MKTVLRSSASVALLVLVAACNADTTAPAPALRRLELSHDTRVVTIPPADFRRCVGCWAIIPSDNSTDAGSTFDLGVVRLQPVQGHANRMEVIALSPGLARLSAGSDGVPGGIVVAVLTDRKSNPPIRVSDFHIVPVDDEGALWMQPSLRVVVTPGRIVDLVRIDVAVDSAQPDYPSLCSSSCLQAGSHGLLGLESYPANADLYLRFYQRPVMTNGAALLTYREGRVTRTVVFRETDNVWDYDFVFDPKIPWQSC